MILFPKPEKKKKSKRSKPICENPSCSRTARIKYKGYFTYRLCEKCYFEWYGAFCEWIKSEQNYKCKSCNKEKKHLEIHHDPKRAQGGRHIKDHASALDTECHGLEHGIKIIKRRKLIWKTKKKK